MFDEKKKQGNFLRFEVVAARENAWAKQFAVPLDAA